MKKTIVKSVLGAGFALAAGVVFATPDVSQNFENATELPTGWTGDGTIQEGARAANTPEIGSAISTDASAKYLAVAGTATCTNTSASTQSSYQADFLVNIAEPCDDLSTDGLGGAQIAVAAGTTVDDQGRVAICVCCGSTPSWVTTDALVATGSWARVSLLFDYGTEKRCRVSVNGVPAGCVTGENAGSAYYPLITTTKTKIDQLDFVGVAGIDDVVINPAEILMPANATVTVAGTAVKLTTLNKYGISAEKMADSTTTVGDSGLTAMQKYEAGLNLTDNSKFEPTAMALTKDGETLKATITIPVADDNGQAYSVVVTDGSSTRTITEGIATVSVTGGKALTFPIPTDMGAVLKFTVKASL